MDSMENNSPSNRRKYPRYETDVKIQFYVSFDIETKVEFRVKEGEGFSLQKYSGVSKNVSAEGLCLSAEKELAADDLLLLEVFVPTSEEPVLMQGRVMWCRPEEGTEGENKKYGAGIKLIAVNDEIVSKTIFIDPECQVAWSVVLESVFGHFKESLLKKKSNPPPGEDGAA